MTKQELQAKRDIIANKVSHYERLRGNCEVSLGDYIQGLKFLIELDNLIDTTHAPPFRPKEPSLQEPLSLADEAAKAEAHAAMEAELAKVAQNAVEGLANQAE